MVRLSLFQPIRFAPNNYWQQRTFLQRLDINLPRLIKFVLTALNQDYRILKFTGFILKIL